MTANVSTAWGDLALLSSYIITGLVDSCAVFIWGSFLSMQTGMVATAHLNLHYCTKSNACSQETPSMSA